MQYFTSKNNVFHPVVP